ncbi:MAG TPA: hypothetical protein VNA30_02030 [Mycobacteriales bacterium]|nr:hypothetical protein [Mycobacteriales bacterium]
MGPRWRAALGLAAVAVAALAAGATAETNALTCPQAGADRPWQDIPVPPFRGIDGVNTTDVISAYAVQATLPSRLLATNGASVQASDTSGCAWGKPLELTAVPPSGGVSGATARITDVALLTSGAGVLALREGVAPAARPRVLRADDGVQGPYSPGDEGLPPAGTPGLLVPAGDGRTVYMTIETTASPAGLVAGGPTALYVSLDAGKTWQLRTPAADLADSGPVESLAVDRATATLLYAVSEGRLLISENGGRSFTPAPDITGVTAVEVMGRDEVAVFRDGGVLYSANRGRAFGQKPAPRGVTSAAWRGGDGSLAVESSGALGLLDPRTGAFSARPSRVPAQPGSLRGDNGAQSTFHAVAGHSLLRYADPRPARLPGDAEPLAPPPIGDLPPAPPNPGTVSPSSVTLDLDLDESRTVDYVLDLPRNPSPLDVFYLVDTSPTMGNFIAGLKTSIQRISNALAGKGISLSEGVGIVTSAPTDKQPPDPEVDPGTNGYQRPAIYRALRTIGPPDRQFVQAVQSIEIETVPSTRRGVDDPAEATAIGLDQLVTGRGVLQRGTTEAAPIYSVRPGQQAGFRRDAFTRRVVVLATDETLVELDGRTPHGTPLKDGKLDWDLLLNQLRGAGVQVFGVTNGAAGADNSLADLTRLARGTGAVAPPGGAACEDIRLAPGAPLVCPNDGDFGGLLLSVLGSLRDVQDLTVVRPRTDRVVTGVAASSFRAVDVSKDNLLRFQATFSCRGLPAGSYPATIVAELRGSPVGRTTASVRCVAPAPAVARPALPKPVLEPAPLLAPLPLPVPAAPPAQANAQPNLNPNAQVQPLPAAMIQDQKEVQLATAIEDFERQQDEQRAETELAMVGRPQARRTPVALLLASLALASGMGLSRLGARSASRVCVARH